MFFIRAWVAILAGLLAGGVFSTAAAATGDDVQALIHAGQYQRAAELAREAMTGGYVSERWPRLLIECQMTTGQYEDALQTYQAAVRRYPGSLTLRYEGLDVLRFNGLDDEATRAEADLFEQLQRAFARYITRDDLIAAGRFLTDRGEDARKVLELFYDRVRERDAQYVPVHIATAELALSKTDDNVAAESLRKAIELEPDNPQSHHLLGLALQSSDREAADRQMNAALELNPRHSATLRWQAEQKIDAERYDEAQRILDQVLKVNANDPLAWALRAVIDHLRGDYEAESQHRQRGLSTWGRNPEVDHRIGKKLSQHYRFAEGAVYQNRALEFDPKFQPARFQLAQDRLRLGDEDLGWEIAGEVSREDPYNVVAYNLMTLRDKTAGFTVLSRDGIRVRMQDREAKLYGDEVLNLLTEARTVLCERYQVTVDKPVIVEIFPEQNDFAIRTFGLPGGAGYLGVCFGRVITANSPASQGQRPANWQSVLWHEFAHVVTLEKTRNRMPRWLSEGISVYEERQRDRSWGEKMSPSYRQMILGKDLVPVSELSGAFLSPKSPLHLQFAYYQSSLVVEFLIGEYGIESLLSVLGELAVGLSINDALARHIGPIDGLDERFRRYAVGVAEAYGAAADWSRDGLPPAGSDVDQWRGWVRWHPTNYWGLRRLAETSMAAGRWTEAAETLGRMASLDVLTFERDGPLEWAAVVQQQLGDVDAERRAIRRVVAQTSDALPTLRRQIELSEPLERWEAMLAAARAALAIQPLLPEFHAAAARSAEKLEHWDLVQTALAAVLTLDPVDPAAVHLRMAQAAGAAQPLTTADRSLAKRHVLMALELAPRYREAHQLLLKLIDDPPPDAKPTRLLEVEEVEP